MDFHRRLTLLPLIAVCLCGVLNAQIYDGNTTQYGELSCVTNGDILTVDITVVKNGSNIIGVEYAQFTDWKNRYRSGDCVFTGDGSLANPFKTSIQVNISSDASTSTSSYCGHKQVGIPANGDPKVYSWVVQSYCELNRDQLGDLYIRFTCAANDLPTFLSINYTVLPPTEPKILDPNNGVLRMDVVNTNNEDISSVLIGSEVRLQLAFTPSAYTDDGHSIDLRPWGIYCEQLYATPAIGSPRKVYLQDTEGCPIADMDFFTPTFNFKNTNAANKYIARTGNMMAARFDALLGEPFEVPKGDVYFVCVGRFCVLPSNGLCEERCQNTSRRKRQDPTEPVTLITHIKVVDFLPETPKEASSFPVGYIVGLCAAGAVVLAAIVMFGVCMCRRRPQHREKYCRHSNPSSVASTTTTKHSRTGSSAYSSSNKGFTY